MTFKSFLSFVRFTPLTGIIFIISTISATVLETLFMYVSVKIVTNENLTELVEQFGLSTKLNILFVIVFGLLSLIVLLLNLNFTEKLIAKCQIILTEKFLLNLFISEYPLIRSYSESEITNIIYLDTNRIAVQYFGGYLNIAKQLISICFVLSFILYMSPQALFFLFPFALLLLLFNNIFFLRKLKLFNVELSQMSQNLFVFLKELSAYTKEILINKKEKIVTQDVVLRKSEFSSKQAELAILNAMSRSTLQYLSIIGVTILVLYMTLEFDLSSEFRSEIIAILALLGLKLAPNINQLIQHFNKSSTGKTFLRKYMEAYNNLGRVEANILENLEFQNQGRRSINLKEGKIPAGKGLNSRLTMRLSEGQLNILSGRSGSGKTTLLDSLGGLWGNFQGFPAGRVVYRAQSTYLPDAFFQDLKAKFESCQINKGSVAHPENVMNALKITRDMLLEENRISLSGGEVQRIALLDALLTEGDVILFD